MIHAAALIAGAAGLWLWLSPSPFSLYWLAGGAGALVFVLAMAWRMRLLDREGGLYFNAPGLALLSLGRLGASWRANLGLARLSAGLSMRASPALIRLKTQHDDDLARALLANVEAGDPGILAVECDDDSILFHTLVEDDGDHAEMRATEKAVWNALGKKTPEQQVAQQQAEQAL
jgi:multisubunit Na+/H+ antiporter MnhE subunit